MTVSRLVYVSITGLRVKGMQHVVRFWWHALRSMAQAHRAPGNLKAEARTINGVHHTLLVWTDQASMRAYLSRGAHRQAMSAFHTIATGRTVGFLAEKAPEWNEVHAIWNRDGKEVQRRVKP